MSSFFEKHSQPVLQSSTGFCLVLTPEMVIIVTIPMHVSNPFSNGAKEIKETYMRICQFDYKKANCYPSDFEYVALD